MYCAIRCCILQSVCLPTHKNTNPRLRSLKNCQLTANGRPCQKYAGKNRRGFHRGCTADRRERGSVCWCTYACRSRDFASTRERGWFSLPRREYRLFCFYRIRLLYQKKKNKQSSIRRSAVKRFRLFPFRQLFLPFFRLKRGYNNFAAGMCPCGEFSGFRGIFRMS